MTDDLDQPIEVSRRLGRRIGTLEAILSGFHKWTEIADLATRAAGWDALVEQMAHQLDIGEFDAHAILNTPIGHATEQGRVMFEDELQQLQQESEGASELAEQRRLSEQKRNQGPNSIVPVDEDEEVMDPVEIARQRLQRQVGRLQSMLRVFDEMPRISQIALEATDWNSARRAIAQEFRLSEMEAEETLNTPPGMLTHAARQEKQNDLVDLQNQLDELHRPSGDDGGRMSDERDYSIGFFGDNWDYFDTGGQVLGEYRIDDAEFDYGVYVSVQVESLRGEPKGVVVWKLDSGRTDIPSAFIDAVQGGVSYSLETLHMMEPDLPTLWVVVREFELRGDVDVSAIRTAGGMATLVALECGDRVFAFGQQPKGWDFRFFG